MKLALDLGMCGGHDRDSNAFPSVIQNVIVSNTTYSA